MVWPAVASANDDDERFFSNWSDSAKAEEDTDGDGKADVWRTFHANGQLKTLKTATLTVHYAKDGEVTRKEFDVDADGKTDTVVTYEKDKSGRPVERTATIEPGSARFNRFTTLFKAPQG